MINFLISCGIRNSNFNYKFHLEFSIELEYILFFVELRSLFETILNFDQEIN